MSVSSNIRLVIAGFRTEMKLTLIDISWSVASSVSHDAKVTTCIDLETQIQVIVCRQYLAILEDLM